MMNGVALFLVLTTLVSGSFWSPTAHENNANPNVITKEGYRSVVVEYDQEGKDGNTKIYISPQHNQSADISKEEMITKKFSPAELVCDTLGACKHKLVNVFQKVEKETKVVADGTKDGAHKVTEMAKKVADGTKDGAYKMTETAKRAGGLASDNLKGGAHKVTEMAEKVADGTTETAKMAGGLASDNLKGGANKVTEMAEKVADGTTETAKMAGGLASNNLKGGANKVTEMAEKVADGSKDGAYKMTETAKRAGGLASDNLKGGANKVTEMAEKTIETHRNIMGSLKDMLLHLVCSNGVNSMIGVVHLLGFSMAFGMSMWMTFVSTYVLGDAMPRQQFGMLQSKLYPVYFKLQAYSIGAALITLLHRGRFLLNRWEVLHATNILISLLLSLVNLLYLEPRATQVMFERFKLEKDAGRRKGASRPTSGTDDAGEPVSAATTERQEEVQTESQIAVLSEKLRTLNRYSSYVNIVTVMLLSLHLVYLGQNIQINCN